MSIGEKDEQGKRTIIVSLNDLTSRIESTLSIYVHLLDEKGKIRADAYSLSRFETPNGPKLSDHVFEDSNFIDKKEVMPYDDFIHILAELNNGKVIDYTLEEGIFFKNLNSFFQTLTEKYQNLAKRVDALVIK